MEDEGSAYMAGLREGDIIVEVDEQNVEEMEHIKIVELITNAKTELKYVFLNLIKLKTLFTKYSNLYVASLRFYRLQ